MFQNNSTSGPIIENSRGFTPSQENKSGGSKKFIISIVIIIALLSLIIVVVMLLFSSNGEIDPGISEDDGIEYDMSDQDTGGGDVEIPDNQTLSFLKRMSIPQDDISTLDSAIRSTLDKQLYTTGFNYIIYDVDNVSYLESTGDVNFSFTTDAGKYNFFVTLKLDSDKHITTYDIKTYNEEGKLVK